MSKVKYHPAKTEVVTIEPEKVVLELSATQAKILKVIVGRTCGEKYGMYELYRNLDDIPELNYPGFGKDLSIMPNIDLRSFHLPDLHKE